MIGKILKDMHCATDNEHYEQARILTSLGYVLLNGTAVWMVWRGDAVGLVEYAQATALYFGAAGGFIFLKKRGGTG